jgi:hypothetical protein
MRWSKKKREREVWEAEELPTNVFEAAREIRTICDVASESALNIAALGRSTDTMTRYHITQYEGAKKRALVLARALSDPLMLDTAINQIIGLCMKANDIRTAEVLCPAIQSETVKDILRVKYPALLIGNTPTNDGLDQGRESGIRRSGI